MTSLAQVVALVLAYCHSVPCSGTCGSLGWPWCRSPWSIWGSATQRRHPRLLAAPWLSSSRPVCSQHLHPRTLALVPSCKCAGAWPAHPLGTGAAPRHQSPRCGHAAACRQYGVVSNHIRLPATEQEERGRRQRLSPALPARPGLQRHQVYDIATRNLQASRSWAVGHGTLQATARPPLCPASLAGVPVPRKKFRRCRCQRRHASSASGSASPMADILGSY